MRALDRPRLNVDPDEWLLSVLRGFLPAGVTVQRSRSNDFLDHLPWVQPRALPGAYRGRMRRFRSSATFAVETYTAEPTAASELADKVTQALLDAYESQTVHAGGALTSLDITASPAELREADQAGRVHHWTATYAVILRPV